VLPPEFSAPPTFDQELNFNHLLAMRMPAAWNVLGATDLAVRPINAASRPTLIVADFFGDGPLDPHVDALYNPALLQSGDPDEHGYHVVGIAAATSPTTAAKPAWSPGSFRLPLCWLRSISPGRRSWRHRS
jgi:hypothetical protein